jgi:hypothetical protein
MNGESGIRGTIWPRRIRKTRYRGNKLKQDRTREDKRAQEPDRSGWKKGNWI